MYPGRSDGCVVSDRRAAAGRAHAKMRFGNETEAETGASLHSATSGSAKDTTPDAAVDSSFVSVIL